MIWLKAFVLGVVQGLTEFLPVSSSGHLVLAQHWIGLDEGGVAFVALLHLGTMFAIIPVYLDDVRRILVAALHLLTFRASGAERKLLVTLLIGMIPIAVVGVVFGDQISAAFESPRFASVMLLVTALLLFTSHRFRHARNDVGYGSALVIGLFQIIAILPGISRSGSTISAGMFAGVKPAEAARFSFLMAVPLLAGAAAVKLPELFGGEETLAAGPAALGFVASAVSGYFAIRWLLRLLARGRFLYFGVYCTLLGIAGLLFA